MNNLTQTENLFFKQIVETNWAAITIAQLNGSITFCNDASLALYGYTSEEIVGKDVDIFNADKNEPTEYIIDTIKSKGVWEGELYQKKSDGTVFLSLLQVWLVKDEQGEPIAIASNSRDVTKNREETLKNEAVLATLEQKEAQLSALINNTNSVIVSINRKYELIEFNNSYVKFVEKLYGKTPIHGKSLSNYIHESGWNEILSICARVFNGETIHTEHDIPPLDRGIVMSIEEKYHPIFLGNEVVAISIFAEDITERRQHEKRLEKAIAEKEFLLNEVHHRVKNNLAIVSSLLHLEELNSENPTVKNILRSSQSRIKSTALVHQFLYQNDSIQSIVFNEYVEEFVNQARSLFAVNWVKDIEIKGDSFHIDIELATPCGLIINELLTNSIKHAFEKSEKSPKITVHLTQNNGKVTITYRDNGIGFKTEEKNARTLGMTIIKTLTKQIKGNFEFFNDQGTVFQLTFPISKPEPSLYLQSSY